jgi:hypothetical protein
MIINNYRYNPTFSPILLEDMTINLKGSDFPAEGKNFKCIGVDALPEYIKDWGSLTAGTWSTDNEDENLELDTNELGQLRMMVLDDVKVRLKNPAPVTKWRTAKTTFYLPQFPTTADEDWMKEYLFRMSELFYFEDTTPRFDLYSAATVTVARVLFTGWKYKLVPVTEKPAFSLLVNSWPGSK